MDIKCAKCGEPWDGWYVRNEMNPEDGKRLMRGEGCESCGFGSKCPECSGTGKLRESGCSFCFGSSFVMARVLRSDATCFESKPWFSGSNQLKVGAAVPSRFAVHVGYLPDVIRLEDPELMKGTILEVLNDSQCRDGWFGNVKLRCPCCSAPPCPACAGSGKFTATPASEERQEVYAQFSAILGGDLDGLQSELEDLSAMGGL